MPTSFFSKLVKNQSNASPANRGPSPSPSKQSLRNSTIGDTSQQDFPRSDKYDAPEMPRLVLTNHEGDGTPIEGVLMSPGSLHRSESLRENTATDTRHRRTVTLALDDRDLPTPTENSFRTQPNSSRTRTSSVPAASRARPPSYLAADDDNTRELPSDIPQSTSSITSTIMSDDKEETMVESPQALNPTTNADPISPTLLPQKSEREVDAVSLASSNGKKTKQTWRSSSTSRKQTSNAKKPTGIAGALAASGLAMANHAQMVSVPASIQQQLPQPPSISKKNTGDFGLHLLPSPSQSTLPSTNDGRTRKRDFSVTSMNSARSKQSYVNDEDDSETGYESPDLDLNDDDIPVTGFAVASNKRNADFHELFRTIPEGDYLIDDYGCALQREILIQGRMYISENHVCFHANIFGWITDLTVPMYDILGMEKKMTAFVIPNAILINTRKAKYTFASFLARDTVFDVMHNIWRTARPDVSSIDATSVRASLEEIGSTSRLSIDGLPPIGMSAASNPTARKAKQCACGQKGEHYAEKVLECVLPGTPEKVYTLLFQSAFMNQFRREEQKLTDIQISDWYPAGPDTKLLSRNMSYIKPLSGPIGPKQTKCEVQDETVHLDYDDYISTVSTTRTPDVPSGSVFAVKTRTCLMWAGNNSSRLVVSTMIEWTGRSFIKSVIEKSALDGQRTYHSELERHIKRYISEHLSEFYPEGEAPTLTEEAAESLVNSTGDPDSKSSYDQRRAPDRRGLQWALDTFTGAYKVGKQSATGAIELLRDAWDGSSTNNILYGLVVVLFVSNIYTFLMVGKREEVGRKKAESRKSVERQQWIGDTVRALLHELRDPPNLPPSIPELNSRDPDAKPIGDEHAKRLEVISITEALETLERRVAQLRSSLADLDKVSL